MHVCVCVYIYLYVFVFQNRKTEREGFLLFIFIIVIIMNRCVLALSAIWASSDGSSELCIIKLIGNSDGRDSCILITSWKKKRRPEEPKAVRTPVPINPSGCREREKEKRKERFDGKAEPRGGTSCLLFVSST